MQYPETVIALSDEARQRVANAMKARGETAVSYLTGPGRFVDAATLKKAKESPDETERRLMDVVGWGQTSERAARGPSATIRPGVSAVSADKVGELMRRQFMTARDQGLTDLDITAALFRTPAERATARQKMRETYLNYLEADEIFAQGTAETKLSIARRKLADEIFAQGTAETNRQQKVFDETKLSIARRKLADEIFAQGTAETNRQQKVFDETRVDNQFLAGTDDGNGFTRRQEQLRRLGVGLSETTKRREKERRDISFPAVTRRALQLLLDRVSPNTVDIPREVDAFKKGTS